MNARRARPPTRVDAYKYTLGLPKLRKDLVDVKLRKRAYGKEWVLIEKKNIKNRNNKLFLFI